MNHTIDEYHLLTQDAFRSGDLVAALACARFLLDRGERTSAWDICTKVSSGMSPSSRSLMNRVLRRLSAQGVMQLLEAMSPRQLHDGEVLTGGEGPDTQTVAIVSGTIAAEVPDGPRLGTLSTGDLLGVVSLWIPHRRGTETWRALTDGLVLEIPTNVLRTTLESVADAGRLVDRLVCEQLVQSIVSSPRLFPDIGAGQRDLESIVPAECQRYVAGGYLDLEHAAYVLISGRVEICPTQDVRFVIERKGTAGEEAVLGIVCSIGKPDGPVASILDHAVVVKIAHATLLGLQERIPSVLTRWNALWGQRMEQVEAFSRGISSEARYS